MLERNAPVQISRKFRTSNAARNAGRRPGRASTVAEAGSSEVRADYFLVFFAEAAIAAILRAFKTSSRRFRRRLISCCRSIIESVCLQKNGCAWREAAILPWMPGSGDRPAARGESLPAFERVAWPRATNAASRLDFFAQEPEYSRYSGPSAHRQPGASLVSVLARSLPSGHGGLSPRTARLGTRRARGRSGCGHRL